MQAVGNDIVDLKDVFCQGKHENGRFLNKICTSKEITAIGESIDPHQALWTHWAIKESAYKAFMKVLTTCTFAPKKFVVSRNGENYSCEYKDVRSEVRVFTNPEYVHAIAAYGKKVDWSLIKWKVALATSEENSSQEARQLAIDLYGQKHVKVLRDGQAFPQLFCNNELIHGIDISLSHDGRYVLAIIMNTDE